MAFSNIKGVSIRGVSACVPKNTVENRHCPLFKENEALRFIMTTGIERRHIVEKGICSSDLCFSAAEKLLAEMNWDKQTIDLLIFVSQTQDYRLPATACILQHRLGLPMSCMAFDVSLGCSGYVYGLGIASSMISAGHLKRALLLVGNTQSLLASPEDKSVLPLFADAGSATSLEFDPTAREMYFHHATDGSGAHFMMLPDGGCRNPVAPSSFEFKEFGPGIKRSGIHEGLDGMEVFSFGISRAPESVTMLMEQYQLDLNVYDYYLFHQANKFMNERIRKKLKLPPKKVPYNIQEYGNTSCTTLPLLMVTELREQLTAQNLKLLLCAFGVGLSWGSCSISVDSIVCPKLIEV